MKKKRKIRYGRVISVALITTIGISHLNLVNKVSAYEKQIVELKEENKVIQNKIIENHEIVNDRITKTIIDKKEEKIKQQEEQKQEQDYIEKKAIVSYYTHLPDEGGGLGITASGNKVSTTSVAIPRKDNLLQFGDTIIFETLSPNYMKDYNGQYLTRIADDTGNPKYIRKVDNNTYRLDVYCPPFPNETNSQYKKRVLSYGKTETNIKIKNKE